MNANPMYNNMANILYCYPWTVCNLNFGSSSIYSLKTINHKLILKRNHHVPSENNPEWLGLDSNRTSESPVWGLRGHRKGLLLHKLHHIFLHWHLFRTPPRNQPSFAVSSPVGSRSPAGIYHIHHVSGWWEASAAAHTIRTRPSFLALVVALATMFLAKHYVHTLTSAAISEYLHFFPHLPQCKPVLHHVYTLLLAANPALDSLKTANPRVLSHVGITGLYLLARKRLAPRSDVVSSCLSPERSTSETVLSSSTLVNGLNSCDGVAARAMARAMKRAKKRNFLREFIVMNIVD
ncbi:hypothetical protein OWV82_023761 [Melia azedarach]|uniref:Uncharacterized protein n=1 Tax=Melia azedarach TaxID=155640 RepID=A0ACC1WY09_MELAZ|nr:hypothetical protein OWV82_023761 [Melia azedarach]